jgi:regulator of protease activity HflC (stomatin/prohibitin superfamily)
LPSLRHLDRRFLYFAFLVILFFIYWLFAWQIERITLTADRVPFPVPQSLLPYLELFLPRVLRHFIPLILGWVLARELAIHTLQLLYGLPDFKTASEFLRRLLAPSRAVSKLEALSPGTLEIDRRQSIVLRVGGPGKIRVPTGHVAVTELDGRHFRVVDAGTHSLDRFEQVRAVLDLRPQERTNSDVQVMSREGLPVRTEVGVTFRISTGDEPVTVRRPFPFDNDAVRRLAYGQTNQNHGQTASWENSALGAAAAALAEVVYSFTLNELLEDPETELGSHLTIRREVERKAKQALREQGIELLRVRIGRFQFPEGVSEQFIRSWQTQWASQAQLTRLDGAADAIEELELAQAEAEMAMIQAIVEGMRGTQRHGYSARLSEVLAVRSVQSLERLLRQSNPDEPPVHLLGQLQALQQQLLPGDNP